MLARQRQEQILRQVQESGGVRVTDLVTQFGVSDMTVRRDIEALAAKGLVDRVHGGATRATERSVDEPGFQVKSEMNTLLKSEIARTAASLIQPGSSVAVSAGTTAYAVAVALQPLKRLTVVTNSPRVEEVLHDPERDDRLVVLTGGVRTPSDALAGPVANAMLATTHVDTLILGVHGIDLEAGLTTPNLQEAQTNRALIKSAKRVVVVADHSKWGVIGLSTIATLDDIHILVTDANLDEEARREISEHGVQLIVAQEN
ncbi:DeoR/GlpR transcriptional regulator [Calidifontibacter sp. DB0510]|uniref:DeoR/GlpR transcriptional regulator n=1 Tax=Metallococcus carri TaxID=1656884 RepID=A0A967B0J8_9MICO|nr:DeoR/GlpR family DNA-binding transcription regulator [Metallococcus carri]NHN56564.1 DeoR/GlpR transcriptional regulator [Metallococcus carri]NOP38863.1 DeoR/GlpR transcriptional regulator [Calidifontibacter sp. DB2511S]